MIMEVDKSPNLQGESASWRPRRADGVVPVWRPAGLTQEESVFLLESKAGKKTDVPVWRQASRRNSLLLGGGSALLFYSGLQLIGWGPPTLRRAICFTQSTDLHVNLFQKHPHRNTQNNVWPNLWAPHGTVKLTHKMRHHRVLNARIWGGVCFVLNSSNKEQVKIILISIRYINWQAWFFWMFFILIVAKTHITLYHSVKWEDIWNVKWRI